MEVHFGWAHSAGDASWRWLLRILSHETNSPLASEIQWPTEAERDAQKEILRAIGINSVFLSVIAWVDGVKQYVIFFLCLFLFSLSMHFMLQYPYS